MGTVSRPRWAAVRYHSHNNRHGATLVRGSANKMDDDWLEMDLDEGVKLNRRQRRALERKTRPTKGGT
jgi:hypothetical protein